jgi:glycosyltransferase involved in cell wall biosynthesis
MVEDMADTINAVRARQVKTKPDVQWPLVSVVIPTYNRAVYLVEALDSVLRQAYPNLDLIVVDDGSNDHTGQVLKPYQGQIKLLYQANKGVSAARNLGISAAKGELIAFLDSDDYWLPQKLAIQVAFFLEHHEAQICQTDEIWIRKGQRVNPKRRHAKPQGDIFEASLALCLVSPSAVMIRRPLFDRVGLFDEELPACEDYDLWLRIAVNYPVYLIAEPLIVKRGGHADQLSAMPGLDRYRIYSLCKLLDHAHLTRIRRAAVIRMLVAKCAIYAQGCAKRGRHDEADYYHRLPGRYGVTVA